MSVNMIARALLVEAPMGDYECHRRVIATGHPASPGSAIGPARTVRSISDLERSQPGDILIVPTADVVWIITFTKAAGMISETGGSLSNFGTLARENNFPAVTGIASAGKHIADGTLLQIDGLSGEVHQVSC